MNGNTPATRGKPGLDLAPTFTLVRTATVDVDGPEGPVPTDVDGLLDLTTGEIVPVTDVEALARWRANLADVQQALQAAVNLSDRILVAQMDRRALWTMPAGRRKLTAPSTEKPVTWDAKGVYDTLARLVTRGVITAEAMASAVDIKPVEYVVRAGPIKQLEKLAPVARALKKHKTVHELGHRRISVKSG